MCDEVNLLNFDGKLTDTVSSDVQKRLKNKINEWRDEGILVGYLKYLVDNIRYSYQYVLNVLILACYYEGFDEINDLSNIVFEKVGSDCVSQLNQESPFNVTYDRDLLFSFLVVPIVAVTYENYLRALLETSARETYNLIATALTHEIAVNEDLIKQYVEKQTNRLLCINKDRFSGALDETSRSLFNQLYVHYLRNEKVIFIAEIDNKTTEMCMSLNGQIFNVSDYNEFDRYSATAGGIMHYKIYGLEPGINLPPINDHFHWCRSTVKYTT